MTCAPAPRPRHSRARSARRFAVLVGTVLVASVLTGCLGVPATTSGIVAVEVREVDGWRYEYFRNDAYPCSISGYQTFVIATKVGSSDAATAPLWVKMHGGGVGWFSDTGQPMPTAGQKKQESFDSLIADDTNGLMERVKADAAGFRLLIVSMCSHDIYAGTNTPDPNNPNTTPDGQPRPTTGLIATKSAIQYATGRYPTDDVVLHGTSAGGEGTFNVAWGLQRQGLPPAGIVSDSGVLNVGWELYQRQHGIGDLPNCQATPGDTGAPVLARIDPEIADFDNQPDLLVSTGRLTVPVLHVWNHHDTNSCGDTPMPCPLRDGSTPTMASGDCRHEPLRLAIEAQGPSSRSENLAVCVEGKDTTMTCDRHVVTSGRFTNSDLASAPADYQGAIMTWVHARLADD